MSTTFSHDHKAPEPGAGSGGEPLTLPTKRKRPKSTATRRRPASDLHPRTAHTASPPTDAQLQALCHETLLCVTTLIEAGIQVRVQDGCAILSGAALHPAHIETATEMLKRIPGITKVRSQSSSPAPAK